MVKGMTLNETLEALNFTTSRADPGTHGTGQKHIYDRHGYLVYTGSADDVWRWLHWQGLVD